MVSQDNFQSWIHLLVDSLGPCSSRIVVRDHKFLVLIQKEHSFVFFFFFFVNNNSLIEQPKAKVTALS